MLGTRTRCWVNSYSLLGNVEDLRSVTSKRPSVFQWVSKWCTGSNVLAVPSLLRVLRQCKNEEAKTQIHINLFGCHRLTRAALPELSIRPDTPRSC